MTEFESYQEIDDAEKRFIAAGDMERVQMLADGDVVPSDSVLAVGLQTLARIALGRPLDAPKQT